jgi:hypothetical protein
MHAAIDKMTPVDYPIKKGACRICNGTYTRIVTEMKICILLIRRAILCINFCQLRQVAGNSRQENPREYMDSEEKGSK